MARELDPELEEYGYIVDDHELLGTMCHFLYQAWTHIMLAEQYGVPSAFEHPSIGGNIDVDEIKNWQPEANLAEAYCMEEIDIISDSGKNNLLRFAVSFLYYINQAPDLFENIGIIDDYFRAYGLGLDHVGYEEVKDVTDWEL